MTSKLEIRPYRPEDKPRLLSIWRAASENAHPFFSRGQLDRHQQLVGDVYLPQAETWVALSNAEPLGFIGLLENFIGGLFVAPESHRLGIGRALIDHAFKNRAFLELEVYAANKRAHDFYLRLGFEEISRRPDDDEGLPFENIRLRRVS